MPLVAVALAGCAETATLARETPTGGLVTYPIRTESDVLISAGRHDALRVMRAKCPQGARIVKEGEIPKINEVVDRTWRGQMGTERLWGLHFTCTPPPRAEASP